MSCEGDSNGGGSPKTALLPKHNWEHHSHSLERPPKAAKLLGEDSRLVYEDEGQVEAEELGEEISEKQMVELRPGMQRYLVAVEYIGTRLHGFQQQPNCRTVASVLQEAFKKFVGQPVSVSCSSRTDAGVHALSNVCHVDAERISKRKPGEVLPPHEPFTVKRAINHFLQKDNNDVRVIDIRCIPSDFHARHKALDRTYYYRLLSGPHPVSAFEINRAWHVHDELNLNAMQEACKVLVGCHDFSSFRAAGCEAKSPVRDLKELYVSETVSGPYISSPFDGHNVGQCSSSISNGSSAQFGVRKLHRCLVITARARSFLYHQVRLLVGTLKCVGTGELSVSDVERILDAKNVYASKPMAPAYGLYLGQVRYDLP